MNSLETALAILSSMITPAVLISACASLAISTSNRLSRAMDRTRKLSEQFRQATQVGTSAPTDEIAMLYDQLGWTVTRSRLLQRSLTCLYLSLSIFVATSVTIGVVSLRGESFASVPIVLGLVGAGLLFYTSVLLILEVRIARTAINAELDFVLQTGTQYAPTELLERRPSSAHRGLL